MYSHSFMTLLFRRIVLLVMALLLGTTHLFAQQPWVRTLDKTAYNLLSNGSAVYAYDLANFYRSSDNGSTWSVSPGAPQGSLTDFHINGSSIFALQEFSGVWRSFDNGSSWQQVSYNGASSLRRTAMRSAGNQTFFTNSCMIGRGSTLFVASAWDRVYRSQDAGSTWQVHNTRIAYYRWNDPNGTCSDGYGNHRNDAYYGNSTRSFPLNK